MDLEARLNLLLSLSWLACAPVREIAWGPACSGSPPLTTDSLVWSSLGEANFWDVAEGATWVNSEEAYAALWTDAHGARPVDADFAAEKLLFVKVFDHQSCFEPILETRLGTSPDGDAAFLLVYDDQQQCESTRDFAALFRFEAGALVTPCVAMIGE